MACQIRVARLSVRCYVHILGNVFVILCPKALKNEPFHGPLMQPGTSVYVESSRPIQNVALFF